MMRVSVEMRADGFIRSVRQIARRILPSDNEPVIRRRIRLHRHPVRPVPGDGIRCIAGDSARRRRFHHATLILLRVVAFIELTADKRAARTVDLLRGDAFSSKHPAELRPAQLRHDTNYMVILKFTPEQRREFLHIFMPPRFLLRFALCSSRHAAAASSTSRMVFS